MARHREGNVLSDYPVNVVLLATDLDAVKDFYANKVGLKIINANPGALSFKRGGDSEFTVTKRRRRGVKIEDYDIPGLKTVDGIADIGFAWMAWFIDPARNCIGMLQVK